MKCMTCKYRPNPKDSVQYCDQQKCNYSYGKNPQSNKTRWNIIPVKGY